MPVPPCVPGEPCIELRDAQPQTPTDPLESLVIPLAVTGVDYDNNWTGFTATAAYLISASLILCPLFCPNFYS